MLTLATCRRALWRYGSSVPYTTATIVDIGEFDARLNQVVERFFTLGTWRSMWRRVFLTIFGCTLTLPRSFDTCRGCDPVCGRPFPIYSQFHQFAALGYGCIDGFGDAHYHRGLHLVDENAQSFIAPTGTFTLRAVATEIADPGLSLIGGFDENGIELFGTINLPLVSGATDEVQQYSTLPYIQKVVTQNPVSLYAVDTTTLVATLIANYAPGETTPAYRQYNVGGGMDQQVVRALCKLGFVPAVSDSDLIIPGHVGALKLGLMSLQFEDKTDPQNAAIYIQRAIDLLDGEIAELEAAEQPAFFVSPHFGAGSVRNVR